VSRRQRKQSRSWLGVSGIADYCEVGQGTVRRWVKQGELPAIRLAGGHYRIKALDFREFLRRHGMPIREDFFGSISEKESSRNKAEGKDARL
jgi:excisionase family DNA binding protein